MVILIENLKKCYNKKGLVSKFSLEVPEFCLNEGSIYTLLGPNGSGKTTFIKLILNLVYQDSGSITLFGFDSSKKESRQFLGYLPEDYLFQANYKFNEIVALHHLLKKNKSIDLRKKMNEITEVLKINNMVNKKVGTLSKGMLQSLALTTCLTGENKLLILDEPFNGLDPIQKQKVFDYLLKLNQTFYTSILLTTHILSDAQAISKEIGLMKDGKIIVNDSLQNIINEYNSLENFYFFHYKKQ